MKKIFTNKKSIILLVMILLIISTGVGIGLHLYNSNPSKTGKKEVAKKDTEVIFSFDSYMEITGTKLRFDNQFGRTQINKDDEYITEGKGSWMIMPQGSYYIKDAYPYFQFMCSDTTFKVSNFEKYDKVMLDFYNASDEEIQIEWSFGMLSVNGEAARNDKATYTLAPNAWTTCEYDLTGEIYSEYLYLDLINDMKVSILSRKETIDDTVPTLYVDNMRGHLSDTERQYKEYDINFADGLTFEKDKEQYLFTADSDETSNNELLLSRAKYVDTAIKPKNETFGEYMLMGETSGAKWPAFTLDYGEKYEKGKYLTFDVYVEVDAEKYGVTTYALQSRVVKGGSTYNKSISTNLRTNTWEKGCIQLVEDSDRSWVFLNLEDGSACRYGKDKVKIYMDNFQIVDEYKEEIKDEYVLENRTGNKNVIQIINTPVKVGQIIKFDLEVTPNQSINLFVMGEGRWGNEYHASTYNGYEGKNTIKSLVDKDSSCIEIYVQFKDTDVDWSQNIVKISNIKIEDAPVIKGSVPSKVTFEDATAMPFFTTRYHGTVGGTTSRVSYAKEGITPMDATCGDYLLKLKGDMKSQYRPQLLVKFGKTLPAGTKIRFKMRVDNSAIPEGSLYAIQAKSGNDGTWGTFIYNSTGMNDKKSGTWYNIEAKLTKDANEMIVIFYVNGETDFLKDAQFSGHYNVVYYDNFEFVEPGTEAEPDLKDIPNEVTFETADDMQYFATRYHNMVGATAYRVTYAEEGIAPMDNTCGDYLLKLKGDLLSQYRPQLVVKLGKTVPKGTKVSFKMRVDNNVVPSGSKFAIQLKSGNNETWNKFIYNSTGINDKELGTWYNIEATIPADANEVLVLFYVNGGTDFLKEAQAAGNYNVVYYDNFVITEPGEGTQPEATPIPNAVTFEDAGHVQYFATRYHATVGGTLTRLTYADAGIEPMDNNCGDYLLKLKGDLETQYRPQLVVKLGKTVPKGTKVSFNMRVDNSAIPQDAQFAIQVKCGNDENWNKFIYNSNGSNDKKAGTWYNIECTTSADANEILILFYVNGADFLKEAQANGNYNVVYYDNFVITEPEQPETPDTPSVPSTSDGISFENEADMSYFGTREHATVGGTLTRVKYADAGLTPMDNICGDYLLSLKGDTTAQYRPHLVVKLGKTMPAGTTVSFKMRVDNSAIAAGSKFAVQVKSGNDGNWNKFIYNSNGVNDKELGTWYNIECTIPADANELLVLFYVNGGTDFLREAQAAGNYNVVYYDNFVIIDPNAEKATIEVDFEKEEGMTYFGTRDHATVGGTLTRLTYADAGINSMDNSCGNYLLKFKGDTTAQYRPQLILKFGETLAKGTKVSFKMRVDNDAIAAGSKFAIQAKVGSDGSWTKFNYNNNSVNDKELGTWYDIEFETSIDANEVLILFYVNGGTDFLREAQAAGNYNVVYYDNFVVTAPEVPEISDTIVTFEDASGTELFITRDHAQVGGELTRVTYEGAGITAMNSDCGNYLLKLQGTTDMQYRPQLGIDFGENMPKGTKIKFKIYIDSDLNTSDTDLYIQVKTATSTAFANDKVIFNGNQAEKFEPGTWYEIECTTTAERQYLLIVPYCANNTYYQTAHQDGTYNAIYIDDFSITGPTE